MCFFWERTFFEKYFFWKIIFWNLIFSNQESKTKPTLCPCDNQSSKKEMDNNLWQSGHTLRSQQLKKQVIFYSRTKKTNSWIFRNWIILSKRPFLNICFSTSLKILFCRFGSEALDKKLSLLTAYENLFLHYGGYECYFLFSRIA